MRARSGPQPTRRSSVPVYEERAGLEPLCDGTPRAKERGLPRYHAWYARPSTKSRILNKEHRRFPRSRGALPLMGKLPRVTCVLPQPGFKHFSLKSPLATDFKRWKLLLSHQSIDGEFVHVEVFGDLLRCKQLFWHIVTASDFGNPFMFGYT